MSFLYKGKKNDTPRARTIHAHELFDYLAARPDGVTMAAICHHFGWKRVATNEALRALRLILADGDSITVVSEPDTPSAPWLVRLVGTYDDARWYVTNRLGDLEARIETQVGVARSLEAATDGRSTEGRKARMIRSTLSHLVEQLQLVGD